MRHGPAGAILAALVTVLAACTHTVDGTATWPGARLTGVLLTIRDFPAGVQFDRIVEDRGAGPGGGAPPMMSSPAGCADALTKVIGDDAERGPGAAVKYVVAYDGARMVMTVLTSNLDMPRLSAAADRCSWYHTFFDPAEPGIPITTTRIATDRPDALAYRQTMTLRGVDHSVYFSFENVGDMAVFGLALPTPNPAIPVKGTLPQTFLDIADKQAQRMRTR